MRLLGFKYLPDDFDITSTEGVRAGAGVREGEEEDGEGRYVNLEVEFAYRRLPPPANKAQNAHFLIYLGLGVVSLSILEIRVVLRPGSRRNWPRSSCRYGSSSLDYMARSDCGWR